MPNSEVHFVSLRCKWLPTVINCDMEADKEFGIKWPNAMSNTVIPAVCPEGTGMHN